MGLVADESATATDIALRMTAEPVRRLVGFDRTGETFLSGDRVLRGIYPGHGEYVRSILSRCARAGLFQQGIVHTRELERDPHPELGYEIVLEHERVPFVTYPHEWSASALKDAAIFHIDLFVKLAPLGLTLKDWHPYNILFDGTNPRFVDFTSIIPLEDLPREGYLDTQRASGVLERAWSDVAQALYRMYMLMYEGYFGLPLELMRMGKHADARQRLAMSPLNATDSAMVAGEVFAGNRTARARYEIENLKLRLALRRDSPRAFFVQLKNRVARARVAVSQSAYSSYYDDKGEAFGFHPSSAWTAKQTAVYDTLRRFSPRTVIDIGSNTGWFSRLAARLGSSVVAIDLDEACIDRLYLTAKRDNLPILPLVANVFADAPDIIARTFDDEPSLSRVGGDEPLYTGPAKRLQGELVLALALVHHLALGQGLSFEAITDRLADLSARHLCLEFVDADDSMITGEPAFFPAYSKNPHGFEWYNLANLRAALSRHFASVEVRPSHPATRSMLVCSRDTYAD